MSGEEVKVNPFVQRNHFAVMTTCLDNIKPGDIDEPWGDAQTSALENCMKTTYYYLPFVALGFTRATRGEDFNFRENKAALLEHYEQEEDSESKAPEYSDKELFYAHARAYMSSRHVPTHLQSVIIQEAIRKTQLGNSHAE